MLERGVLRSQVWVLVCGGLLSACNGLDPDQVGTRGGPRAGDAGTQGPESMPAGEDDPDAPGARHDDVGSDPDDATGVDNPDGTPTDATDPGDTDPADPNDTSPDGTTSPDPSDTTAPNPTVIDPTQAGLAEFTRLTRAEYARSVDAAFGVVPDVTQLPEDGRIGPFTSNASDGSEPVHPYLLIAESLASQIVPEQLPACQGDSLEQCLERDYTPAFAALMRRSITTAERDVWAQLVRGLLDQGISNEEASRALVAAILTGSDFLYRSGSARNDLNVGERSAERLSFALWDAPPDAELGNAPSDATLGAWLAEQATRLSQDERATPVLTRFVAQWLDIDSDLLLENDEFAASPDYLELSARVRLALDSDAPVRELISGRSAIVHADNAELYGLAEQDDTLQEVQWPSGSTRRGLLAQELFSSATRHPDTSRRPIFRGLLVRRALLCDTIPAPSAELVALAGEVGDRTEDQRCAACHTRIDPIGHAFAAWDQGEEALSAEVLGHAELEGTYSDVGALLDAVADSRAFAQCFSKHWLGFFLEQPPADVDDAWVALLADDVQAGASLSQVMQSTVRELARRSEDFVPWCEVTL